MKKYLFKRTFNLFDVIVISMLGHLFGDITGAFEAISWVSALFIAMYFSVVVEDTLPVEGGTEEQIKQ